MNTYIFFQVVFSTILAALYMTADKLGWIHWYELNRKTWMPKKCEFCLFFWLNLGVWSFAIQKHDFFVSSVFGARIDAILILFGSGLIGAVYSRFLIK